MSGSQRGEATSRCLKRATKPYRNSIAYVFSAILLLLMLVFTLDYFWLKFSPSASRSPAWPELVFTMAEKDITTQESPNSQEYNVEGQTLSVRIEPLSDIYFQNLDVGTLAEVIQIEKADGIYYLKFLPEKSIQISLGPLSIGPESRVLANVAPIAFYLILAIVLWLWLYPILSGLGRLSYALKYYTVGRSWPLKLDTTSKPVKVLVDSFNELSNRIQSLISTQSDLTRGLSHELRTPLARAKFALASARSQLDCDSDLLNSIGQDIEEMEFLTNAMLEYSRIQAMEEISIDDELSLIVLIEAVRSSYQWKTPIPIEVNIEGEHKELLSANSALLRIALSNLLSNAIKYADSKIVIEFSRVGGKRHLTVLDDGCGIADEHYESLLRPFERISHSDEAATGFGLGLAVVNRIMILHKGTVLLQRSQYLGLSATLEW